MSKTLAHTHARRALAALLLTLSCAAHALARQTQTPTPAKDPASLSGRVTSNGKPAREVPVVLMPGDWYVQREPVAKGVTDEEGRYKLTNVPPGRYHLTAVSPGYIFAEGGANEWQQGKVVNVSAGDELKNLDFTLVRGGVVTGRVTDSDGRAVVEETVTLLLADTRERKERRVNPFTATTDDRGVYRAWGVTPGRYVVYSGRARDDIFRGGTYDAGAFYPQTFYPSVTEESQARAVEVKAGGEEDEVDITLAKLTKTHTAKGRVVDEEGRAVVGVDIAVGPMTAGGQRFSGNMFSSGKTDERGEFTVRGLMPGDWGVWAASGEVYGGTQGPTYSDPAVFEVEDSDVSGLEIKMRRGAEVSGAVTLEGTSDPAVLARFKETRMGVWVNTGASSTYVPNYTRFQAAADGSFKLTGLRPGRLMFDLEWPRPKGFSLLYVRRDGVEQREGMELKAGERVRNVQVAYTYGNAVIRGEVQFKGGTRPAGVTYAIHAVRPGGAITGDAAILDSLGRFTIENLSPGEYELSMSDWSPNAANRSPLAKVSVSVPADGEVKTTLVYDMTPKKEGQ
ncbi:MAG TPA: carboxypeptidase-like regulatory domain-containing protein [Pyrinomonadaceae bacterium]|jgi:protocatechuate 3,4-dioxygenase beta subunit|nr:carboxypeptidase-like regulatory domain-containing protein [Pyrinomonadaceae bacterium]